jgi:hypothetical protein
MPGGAGTCGSWSYDSGQQPDAIPYEDVRGEREASGGSAGSAGAETDAGQGTEAGMGEDASGPAQDATGS